jgi:type VI secretion system secreted protein Hcp
MAETVHLFLKASGNDIQGNSSQVSLGRENSIECLSFESSVITAREKGSGMATGRRQHNPIVFLKRIDKATPLIAKALCTNEVIVGKFKFFRPNPTGDGTTQQFYTIDIAEGRIASQRQLSPNTIVPASTLEPPQEEVTIVFGSITWTYEDGGITHADTWREQT